MRIETCAKATVLTIALLLLLFSVGLSQSTRTPDLVGTWVIDAEKSYSKSERSKLSNYTLTITQHGDEIRLGWDYTIDNRRSNYSELLIADGEEHDYPRTRGGDEWEPWSETTKWKKGKLLRKFSYRTTRQTYGAYRDRQEFSLNATGDILTVTNFFVAAGPPPPSFPGERTPQPGSSTSERKLVFNRKPN